MYVCVCVCMCVYVCVWCACQLCTCACVCLCMPVCVCVECLCMLVCLCACACVCVCVCVCVCSCSKLEAEWQMWRIQLQLLQGKKLTACTVTTKRPTSKRQQAGQFNKNDKITADAAGGCSLLPLLPRHYPRIHLHLNWLGWMHLHLLQPWMHLHLNWSSHHVVEVQEEVQEAGMQWCLSKAWHMVEVQEEVQQAGWDAAPAA